jgi:hypothetical protein
MGKPCGGTVSTIPTLKKVGQPILLKVYSISFSIGAKIGSKAAYQNQPNFREAAMKQVNRSNPRTTHRNIFLAILPIPVFGVSV